MGSQHLNGVLIQCDRPTALSRLGWDETESGSPDTLKALDYVCSMLESNVRPQTMTPRQARVVAEYLTDLNATQAAIRAGYSPKTAKSIGSENLTKPAIAEAIARQ
jgi:hypothetical protein